MTSIISNGTFLDKFFNVEVSLRLIMHNTDKEKERERERQRQRGRQREREREKIGVIF